MLEYGWAERVLTPTLRSNGALWSLAYEIWFYVIGGVVGYLYATRRVSLIAIVALLAGLAVFSILKVRYLVFWVLGAFCALAPARFGRPLYGSLGAALALAGIALYQGTRSFPEFPTYEPVAEGLICIGLCGALPCLGSPTTAAAIERLRGLASFLSHRSYTLYLVHSPSNVVLDSYFGVATELSVRTGGMFLARLLIIGLFVELTYRLFEANTPILKRIIKSRFRS